MLFNTFTFFAFLAVVLVVQALLPHRPRNLFLLASSWFFYACWDWRFLSLILISTAVDYGCGLALGRENGDAKLRKRLVTLSLVVNLGLLGFFKYAGFFVDSAQRLFESVGFSPDPWHLHIVLPVGISFYTFQTLSYTIDVYRGQLKPLRDPFDFALYVAFFPQLVAGPIERAAHLAPQFTRKAKVSARDWEEGGWLVLWGLFKKCVIADNLAPVVEAVYANPAVATGPEVLIATYAFAFQIYCDFSGYTDIARGVSRWLGYDLRLNFNLPYVAAGLRDFWRRWHISLSSWLRDYLYIPLGGNRGGSWLTARNLMITMLLGGLWHGAAWTFVVWGALHGLYLGIERIGAPWWRKLAVVLPRWLGQSLAMVLTFHLVCMSWVFFRAGSLGEAMQLLNQLSDWGSARGEISRWLWQMAILLVPLLGIQLLQWRTGDHLIVLRLSAVTRLLILSVLLWQILALGVFGEREFIYFQF